MRQCVIRRVDQGGGWVTKAGSQHSYSKRLQDAKVYATFDQAAADVCPENEIIERLDHAMGYEEMPS